MPWLEALAEGDAFAAQFDVPAAPDRAAFPDAIAYALEAARWGAPELGWPSLLRRRRRARRQRRLEGQPIEDIAELGYAVAPSRQGRGLATRARFALAFCESSGPWLVRRSGLDDESVERATRNMLAIGAGHSLLVCRREGFPVNALNHVKQMPEICRIFRATANPVAATRTHSRFAIVVWEHPGCGGW